MGNSHGCNQSSSNDEHLNLYRQQQQQRRRKQQQQKQRTLNESDRNNILYYDRLTADDSSDAFTLRRLSTSALSKISMKQLRLQSRLSLASNHPMSRMSMDSTGRSSTGQDDSPTNGASSSDGGQLPVSVPEVARSQPHSKRLRFLKRSKAVDEGEQRLKFISSHGSLTMSSFETGEVSNVEVTIKPLKDRSRSLSPMKQFRMLAMRITPSQEGVLTDMQINLIRTSWQQISMRIETNELEHDFGHYVFRRVFASNPAMKQPFGVPDDADLQHLPADHPVNRPLSIFSRLITLTVRNIEELETEIAPALFRYGQRHYNGAARDMFNEKTVRLVCTQVVCTVADLNQFEVDPVCMEAWIELMRYVGRNLLEGFNFERSKQSK